MGGERGRGRAPAIPWGKEPEPVAKSGGMKLDVVPVAVVSNGSDVSARVTAKLRVDDSHTLSLEADDSSFRDGVSKKGMTVGFCKKGAFDMHYGLDADAPKFVFHTDATVLDKDVALRFRHALKGDTDLRAKFDVDDKTSATLTYDLANFGSPDLKSLSVAAKYQHNADWSVEPAYNMGTESFSVTVDHRLDGDNSLQAKYDQGSNVAPWSGRPLPCSATPGAPLKIRATSSLSNDALKSMPTIRVEKSFDTDL